jgi:gluconolactonase
MGMAREQMRSFGADVDVYAVQMRALIAADAAVEVIADGFSFTEGPAWDVQSSSLVFSDIIGNAMYRWSRAAGVAEFRRPSNMANGNTFERDGALLTCEHATSQVTRTRRDGSVEVVAAHYGGTQLNSPNDIVVHSSGTIYFTDPMSGRSARFGVERPSELGFQGVYRVDPRDGTVTLLADDFALPNGLCFAPDERRLFVNDTRRGHIRVFDVRADGTLAGGEVWADVVGEGEGAPDGMKLDQAGNLWCTGPGGIVVFDAAGRSLGRLRLPERVANFAWGDRDRQTLYITASTSIYALRTEVAGQPYAQEV